jgi:hypothetical protein
MQNSAVRSAVFSSGVQMKSTICLIESRPLVLFEVRHVGGAHRLIHLGVEFGGRRRVKANELLSIDGFVVVWETAIVAIEATHKPEAVFGI